MRLPAWLTNLVRVDDSVLDNQFTLTGDKVAKGDIDSTPPANPDTPNANTDNLRSAVKPVSMRRFLKQSERAYNEGVEESKHPWDDDIPVNLDRNEEILRQVFHMPENKDIVVRAFAVGNLQKWRGLVVFVDGMSDKTVINNNVLQPLMLLSHIADAVPERKLEVVSDTLLPGNQITLEQKWSKVIPGILAGSTAVFIEGCDAALVVETKGWEHRTVGVAQTENVVRGPHDGFTENFRANTALVRSRLRSEHLVTEMFSVGNLGKTDVGVMYVHGLTNPALVDEVRKRVSAIDVDYLADSGIFEQFIEDTPNSMVPQVFSTERPDRIASMLAEGHVAIFVGMSPFVLAVPVTLWTLVHTPEDAYLRSPYGTFLRLLRWCALGVALLTPAFYVATTNYHPEMIPTDLLLAIAGSREQVPFPVVVEVLLMEFAMELIREAGIRIPSVIGPTIGIVGALIIGQAAVQAGVVSPLLVIVIATTALASFTIPNYNLNLAVRVLRFGFLFAAAILGFYGIALLLCIFVVRLSVTKSFGVPFLAPVAPSMDSAPDVLIRGHVYAMNQRPSFLQTQRSWRQQPVTRPWSPITRPSKRR